MVEKAYGPGLPDPTKVWPAGGRGGHPPPARGRVWTRWALSVWLGRAGPEPLGGLLAKGYGGCHRAPRLPWLARRPPVHGAPRCAARQAADPSGGTAGWWAHIDQLGWLLSRWGRPAGTVVALPSPPPPHPRRWGLPAPGATAPLPHRRGTRGRLRRAPRGLAEGPFPCGREGSGGPRACQPGRGQPGPGCMGERCPPTPGGRRPKPGGSQGWPAACAGGHFAPGRVEHRPPSPRPLCPSPLDRLCRPALPGTPAEAGGPAGTRCPAALRRLIKYARGRVAQLALLVFASNTP